jgi:hypothetical protein
VKKLSGTPEDSFWLFSLSDQPLKDQPRGDPEVKYTRKHCFMIYAWLWMNLRIGGNPCSGRFANQIPVGMAHYTGRSLERPVISYSVQSKIGHRTKEVKKQKLFSIHISLTQDINKLLISAEETAI